AATFDFSQAKPDGADLRFTKADGTLLPFAVERYEAANRLAEVWVKVDTVLGNNSTQFITMLWGNPQAPAYSNPIGVFDTAEGYKAVWHMGDTADATIHGNTLQRSGAGNPCAVPGLIGKCMYFDSSHYFNAGLGPTLKGKTDFTISVWVKSTMSYKGYLISNKDSSNTGQFGIEVFETAVCNFWTWNPDSGKYQFDTYSKATVTDGQWHLLTGVRKDSLSSIYIDGVLDTTQSGPVVSLNSSLPTFIGFDNSLSDKYFKGNMDEAMILATARSADWIKLCFMNQKEGDALVSFK
ncbi:MAG TPA: DUF2341 domain-containing protein, partial [Armatimonadota bacterium]|nr:DUF2341 domain-containing protein [Armatimonadota bacterium]